MMSIESVDYVRSPSPQRSQLSPNFSRSDKDKKKKKKSKSKKKEKKRSSTSLRRSVSPTQQKQTYPETHRETFPPERSRKRRVIRRLNEEPWRSPVHMYRKDTYGTDNDFPERRSRFRRYSRSSSPRSGWRRNSRNRFDNDGTYERREGSYERSDRRRYDSYRDARYDDRRYVQRDRRGFERSPERERNWRISPVRSQSPHRSSRRSSTPPRYRTFSTSPSGAPQKSSRSPSPSNRKTEDANSSSSFKQQQQTSITTTNSHINQNSPSALYDFSACDFAREESKGNGSDDDDLDAAEFFQDDAAGNDYTIQHDTLSDIYRNTDPSTLLPGIKPPNEEGYFPSEPAALKDLSKGNISLSLIFDEKKEVVFLKNFVTFFCFYLARKQNFVLFFF